MCQVGFDAAFDDDAIAQLIGVELFVQFLKMLDKRCEPAQLGGCALVDIQVVGLGIGTHFEEGLTGCHDGCNLVDGGLANAASRIIDDALECLLVGRIGNESQIADDILDLLALIERQASVDAIEDVALAQRFLERAALCIGAVEDGNVAVVITLVIVKRLYTSSHLIGFLQVGVGAGEDEFRASVVFAEDCLAYLILVLRNERIGGIHNVLRRAIVLLQLEKLGVGDLVLHIQNVVDIGTTERID